MRQARAEPHVADRRVHDGGAAGGQAIEIVAIEPNRMSGGEMRPEHAERVEVRGQRLAVLAQAQHRLCLGLGEMGLQRQVVGPRQIATPDQKFIAAMDRNGRRDGRTDPFAIERPIGIELFGGIGGRPIWRELEREYVGAQRVRHGGDQAGVSLVQRIVRDHRRDHRAHARVPVRLAKRDDAITAGQRELEEQVVAGGTAFADHLDRGDEAVEILVFERPIACHAGHGIEE